MKVVIVVLCMLVFGVFLSGASSAQECSVDAFELEVNGNEISVEIWNNGENYSVVSYRFFVNGDRISASSIALTPDDVKEVSNSYSFSPGEWEITVEVEADCGATDSETVTHFIFDDVECFPPVGVEGEEYCDYQSRELLVCHSGSWRTVASGTGEYCTSCGPQVCGDGVCNCYEVSRSCPSDCGPYYPPYPPYPPRPSKCVSITGLDFVEFLHEGDSGKAIVHVQNDAQTNLRVETSIIIDGDVVDEGVIVLSPLQEGNDVLSYSPEPGIHVVEIKVDASCGEDSQEFTLIVSEEYEPIVFMEPVLPEEEVTTSVTVLPQNIDIPIYTGKAIGITIRSNVPQTFSIEVHGVPSDFASFESSVDIMKEDVVFVYLTPNKPGDYDINVRVTAMEEGLVFEEDVRMFVVNPLSFSDFDGNDTIPFSATITVIVIVVIILMVLFAYTRSRQLYFHEYYRSA